MNFKQKKINISRLYLLIFCLMSFGIAAYGQTYILNDQVISPPAAQPSASCTNSSAAFNTKYNTLPFYIPTATTPLKTIKVNVNVFCDNNGGNEFPNNAASRTRIAQIVEWASGRYQYIQLPSDPIPGVPFISDSKIRFVLNNIYFYNNTTANQSEDFSYLFQLIKQADPERSKQLNICFTAAPTLGNTAKALEPSFSDMNYEQGYIAAPYFNNPGSDWAAASTMAHEIGHCMNIHHTYGTSWRWETTNPSNIDFLSDVFSTVIKPNCAVVPTTENTCLYHGAGFACQPKNVNDSCTNNMMGGSQDMGYLSPKQMGKLQKAFALSSIRRYIDADAYTLTPQVVNTTEVWDFNSRIYSDLNLTSGGNLTISCALTIPYLSQIIVGTSSTLKLDNANITSPFACKGITVQNGGCLNLTNSEVNNYNITVKSGGTLIINGTLTVQNASEINVESGGYICFNGTAVNLQNNNNVINLHPGYLTGVNTTYVPAIGTCKAANIVTVTGSGHINTQFSTVVYLQNTNISTNQYYTGSSIFAGSNVTTSIPSGPVKILSTGKVIINAENDIIINSVFEALSGCSFELK